MNWRLRIFLLVLLAGAATLLGMSVAAYHRAQRQIAGARVPLYAAPSDATTQPLVSFQDDTAPGPRVRVAVIGGMFETGFWSALARRYLARTGVHITLVAAGPKNVIAKAFCATGTVDLITMHSSDIIINLVADGYCLDPQPWMRNDQMIVGPADDPAGIRGMTDATAALRKIAATHAPFVVHSSLGTQEVLRGILEAGEIHLDESKLTLLFLDEQHDVLKITAAKHAYTLVGRIPFRDGKMDNPGLVAMVAGDPKLRRPYVVAIANPARFPHTNTLEARRLAAWLRSPQTQAWITTYGRGQLDDLPLFYPVTVPDPAITTRPASTQPAIRRSS